MVSQKREEKKIIEDVYIIHEKKNREIFVLAQLLSLFWRRIICKVSTPPITQLNTYCMSMDNVIILLI